MSERKKRRIKFIVVILIILVITVVTGIILWSVHIRQLRNEMNDFLVYSVINTEQGNYDAALSDAGDALILAQRLRDDEAIGDIEDHIVLIETIIRGNAQFDAGDYNTALNTFLFASDHAKKFQDLNTDLIDEKIVTTEMFILFYSLIDHADNIIDVLVYMPESLMYEDALLLCEEALSFYEDAMSVADALSYTAGVRTAVSGIEEVQRRIIEIKHNEAMNLFIYGDQLYNDGHYAQSIEYFEDSLEIFIELDEPQLIFALTNRVNLSKRRVAEEEAAAAIPPETEVPDDTEEQSGSSEESVPESNYEHNQRISFDLRTLIDDQNRRPANQIRMGTRDGLNEGWYNGCGWVAVYNALIILDDPKHPAEIVHYFEMSGGTVLGGLFGTYPHSIESYLNSLGFNVNHTLFPQLSLNIDDVIKASRVSILAYAHTSAAHYATVEYREDIDKFIVYNDSFARTRSAETGLRNIVNTGAAIDSIAAFINESSDILFSFSLIAVE